MSEDRKNLATLSAFEPDDARIVDTASMGAWPERQVTKADRPTFHATLELHGEHPGEVLFCRDRAKGTRSPRQMETIGAVRVSDLREVFPEYLSPLLDDDAFQTVNGLDYWEGAKVAPLERPSPKIRHRRRLARNIGWLTSCWVDLDLARDGSSRSIWHGLAKIDEMVFDGRLPDPSMFLDSGRGLWVFWLLREPDGVHAIKATPDRMAVQKRVNSELVARISEHAPELMADGNAMDAARLCRVVGSRNCSAEGRRVAFGMLGDESGRVPRYTLDSMAALLGLKGETAQRRGFRPIPEKLISTEQAQRGRIVASENRLSRLAMVFGRWGQIPEGKRNASMFVYACALRWRRLEIAEALDRLDNANSAWCSPPLPAAEIRKTLDSAWSGRFRWSDGEIVHRLGISDEDAVAVGFPTRGEIRVSATATSRKELARIRRDLLVHYVSKTETGEVPTLAAAMDYLARHGVEVSHQTVANDYRAMGWPNPRSRKRRDREDGIFDASTDTEARIDGAETGTP